MADPDTRARFGALLRQHRIARGLSQSALARAARMDPAYICRIENSLQHGMPTRKAIQEIARALLLNPTDTDRFLHTGGAATQVDWQTAYERLVANLEDSHA